MQGPDSTRSETAPHSSRVHSRNTRRFLILFYFILEKSSQVKFLLSTQIQNSPPLVYSRETNYQASRPVW
jgi:hypothetical protein